MRDRRRLVRMIALVAVALAGLLTLGAAYAQAQRGIPKGLTFYGFPAEGWQQINRDAKGWYLMGLFDGMMTAGNDYIGRHVTSDIGFDSYILAIDRLCRDPRNANIPMAFLPKVVTLMSEGHSDADVEEFLKMLRGQPPSATANRLARGKDKATSDGNKQ
jgi:hypothetical protein